MRYLRVEVQPPSHERHGWLYRGMAALLGASNPDIGPLHQEAWTWWLEVSDTGTPLREIGFNIEGEAIVLGPIGRNYGLLVDSPVDWQHSDGDSDEASQRFEERWNELWPKFKHLAE